MRNRLKIQTFEQNKKSLVYVEFSTQARLLAYFKYQNNV